MDATLEELRSQLVEVISGHKQLRESVMLIGNVFQRSESELAINAAVDGKDAILCSDSWRHMARFKDHCLRNLKRGTCAWPSVKPIGIAAHISNNVGILWLENPYDTWACSVFCGLAHCKPEPGEGILGPIQ